MVMIMISLPLMTKLQTLSINDQSFSFIPVTYDDVLKKLNTLDTAKASQQYDIPNEI